MLVDKSVWGLGNNLDPWIWCSEEAEASREPGPPPGSAYDTHTRPPGGSGKLRHRVEKQIAQSPLARTETWACLILTRLLARCRHFCLYQAGMGRQCLRGGRVGSRADLTPAAGRAAGWDALLHAGSE